MLSYTILILVTISAIAVWWVLVMTLLHIIRSMNYYYYVITEFYEYIVWEEKFLEDYIKLGLWFFHFSSYTYGAYVLLYRNTFKNFVNCIFMFTFITLLIIAFLCIMRWYLLITGESFDYLTTGLQCWWFYSVAIFSCAYYYILLPDDVDD